MPADAAMRGDGGPRVKKSMKKQNLPNCITAARMIGALCLVPIRPLSPLFDGLYALAGFTDVLDGWLARRIKAESDFGAKLDSIADLLFYGAMLAKLLPTLRAVLPVEMEYAVTAVLALRLSSHLAAAVRYRKFVPLHTFGNKLAGAAVFCVPFVISLPFTVPGCWAVCALAFIASGEELWMHLCGRTDCAKINISERGGEKPCA